MNDEVTKAESELLPGFNFSIPKHLSGIESDLLNPKKTWKNPKDYDLKAHELIDKFISNFKQFDVSLAIRNAGPVTYTSISG